MIEMNIKGLAVDPLTNVPIVILEEVDGDTYDLDRVHFSAQYNF